MDLDEFAQQFLNPIRQELDKNLVEAMGISTRFLTPTNLSSASFAESIVQIEKVLGEQHLNGKPPYYLARNIRIIESNYAYKTKEKVRGIPSTHKPNSQRPFFRIVRITIPLSFMMNGDTLVCHPSIAYRIKRLVPGDPATIKGAQADLLIIDDPFFNGGQDANKNQD
jgi:hypothetical protein